MTTETTKRLTIHQSYQKPPKIENINISVYRRQNHLLKNRKTKFQDPPQLSPKMLPKAPGTPQDPADLQGTPPNLSRETICHCSPISFSTTNSEHWHVPEPTFNIEFGTTGSVSGTFYLLLPSDRCRQEHWNRGRRCLAVGVFNIYVRIYNCIYTHVYTYV